MIFGDSAVVTTAAMGAGSFLRTDATPLAGHPILVFPDNDAAGQDYVRTATDVLVKLGCAIRVVDVAELVKIDGGGAALPTTLTAGILPMPSSNGPITQCCATPSSV